MALIHIHACTLQQKIFMIVWCRYHLMFWCRSLDCRRMYFMVDHYVAVLW